MVALRRSIVKQISVVVYTEESGVCLLDMRISLSRLEPDTGACLASVIELASMPPSADARDIKLRVVPTIRR